MKNIVVICVFLLLLGCASTPKLPMTEGPNLPSRPTPLIMDNGKYDVKKYPNTKWVKEPKMDLSKGIACWSNKDVETISDALTEWNYWADAVEETVRKYNDTLKGGDTHKGIVPWYKKIF
jgi:hypothetical protein